MSETPYLDSKVIYVFIRQDVEVKHQMVQALHAMRMATVAYMHAVTKSAAHAIAPSEMEARGEGIPFVTTIGMPDAKSMDRVIAKLEKAAVGFTRFHDTDYEFGVIAVATEPLDLSVREKPDGLMCNYRLWNPANNKADGDFYVAYLLGVLDMKTGREVATREKVAGEIFPMEESLRGMGDWGPDELPICPDCRTIMPKSELGELTLHSPACPRRTEVKP